MTLARRVFLKGAGSLGAVALAELMGASRLAAQQVSIKSYGTLKAVDFAPTAKRVIRIHMVGAVSQVDTFDYKPMLEKNARPGASTFYPVQRTAFEHERRAVFI